MKIKETIIDKISSDLNIKFKIAMESKSHLNSVERWIRQNSNNGQLTRYEIMSIISKELNIPIGEIGDNNPPVKNVTINK
jgi:hypothetical protein